MAPLAALPAHIQSSLEVSGYCSTPGLKSYSEYVVKVIKFSFNLKVFESTSDKLTF